MAVGARYDAAGRGVSGWARCGGRGAVGCGQGSARYGEAVSVRFGEVRRGRVWRSINS